MEFQVTEAMRRDHVWTCQRNETSHGSWTSHTVAVVDQSGSMRNADLADGATRSDAVWLTLAKDFVALRLETKEASGTDVFSLVLMNKDSTVMFRHRPIDWLLYNDLVEQLRTAEPMSEGNYFPALDAAEQLLLSNTHGSCALMLVFLSDGKPSDRLPTNAQLNLGSRSMSCRYRLLVEARISILASQFGRRLTVATIGFGPTKEDFSVLDAMAAASEDYGSVGIFQAPSLTVESLGGAMSSLTLSLTETKTELTQLGGESLQRTVRSIVRESRRAVDETRLSDNWIHYTPESVLRLVKRDSHRSSWVDFVVENWVGKDGGFVENEGRYGLAMKKTVFGEGAERMVRKFRLVSRQGTFYGPPMVAKESRFAEDISYSTSLEFHTKFCDTQAQAQRLAKKFNEKLSLVPGVTDRTPRVQFLKCMVFVVMDNNQGRIGLLVEDMLDPTKYMKWNNNAGHVAGQVAAPAHQQGGPLFDLKEEEEEEDCNPDADSIRNVSISIEDADIPQAFTHFTYRHSRRKMMVCDLQGVLKTDCTPPEFQLTDP
eukprot:gene12116-14317_t